MESNKPYQMPPCVKKQKVVLPVNYNKLNQKERRKIRNQYVIQQNHMCYYCSHSLLEEPPVQIKNKPVNKKLFPVNFFKYPIHLHHNHKTGMTIGAVHCRCNAILWEYKHE